MTFYQLSVFLSVANLHSFTGAASDQHMTQPAISQIISNLEKELDQPLLVRRSGQRSPIVLTRAGEIFAEFAESSLKNYREMQIALLNQASYQPFSLVCSPTPSAYLLPQLLSSFQMKFPRVAVKATSLRRSDVLKRLLSQDADIAISAGSLSDSEFVYEKVYYDPLILIIPKTMHKPRYLNAKVIRNLPLILRSHADSINSAVLSYFSKFGLNYSDLNIVMEVSSNTEILRAVSHHLGAGFIPSLMYRAEIPHEELSISAIDNAKIDRYLYIARKADRPLNTGAKLFWDYVLSNDWNPTSQNT